MIEATEMGSTPRYLHLDPPGLWARFKQWLRPGPKKPFDWAELGYASLRGAIRDQERALGEVYLRRATGERERLSRQGEIQAICERIGVFKQAQKRTIKP